MEFESEYFVGTISDLESIFQQEISDQYEYTIAINPATLATDRTIHTLRFTSNGFEDIVREFEYRFNNAAAAQSSKSIFEDQ